VSVVDQSVAGTLNDDAAVNDAAVDDAVGRIALALGRLNRILRRSAPTGLGPGSLSALATLVRSGPLRLGDLAAREGVAPPTLTRIVANLEDAGYVRRGPDPSDGRATRASATEPGAELISGAGSSRASALRARMDALPPAELRILLSAVPVLESLAADDT
jgi:DNA-binding MarR family transcriptional regulator